MTSESIATITVMSDDNPPSQDRDELRDELERRDALLAELLRSGQLDMAALTKRGIVIAEAKSTGAAAREAEAQAAHYAMPGASPRAVRRSGPPRREFVLDAADALRAPASPRLNADIVAIREGVELRPRQYSSIRREDEQTYRRRPEAHARYLVPAIDHDTLAPYKGVVAASDWELERRIATPRALRLWHLDHVLAVLDLLEALIADEADAERVARAERVVWQLARTVPDALVPGKAIDHARVRDAVKAERDELEPLDEPVRTRVVEQLRALPPSARLWGRELRDVKESETG
jgi:hypothetical protein